MARVLLWEHEDGSLSAAREGETWAAAHVERRVELPHTGCAFAEDAPDLARERALKAISLEGGGFILAPIPPWWLGPAVRAGEGRLVAVWSGTGCEDGRIEIMSPPHEAAQRYLGLAEHDCEAEAIPYAEEPGQLGHGWRCGVCGALLQVG